MSNTQINYFILLLLVSLNYSCQKEIPEIEIEDTCIESKNIIAFAIGGKNYEFVKELKTWQEAAICAVERGGYLVEINDATEQSNVASIVNNNVTDVSLIVARDGGDGSYVWLGGNDFVKEGKWVWNGNIDSEEIQFWEGNFTGNAVDGRYNNWGVEPDNFQGQNALALAVTDWPRGVKGEWNDIQHGNKLYFVIEFD